MTTFHGLGLRILRELPDRAGLPADFQVADEAARQRVATELAGSAGARRDLLKAAAAGAGRTGGPGRGADARAAWWTSTVSSSCAVAVLAAEPDAGRRPAPSAGR